MKFNSVIALQSRLKQNCARILAVVMLASPMAACASQSDSTEFSVSEEAYSPSSALYSQYLIGYFAEDHWKFGKAAAMLDDVIESDGIDARMLQRAMLAHMAIGQSDLAVERAYSFLEHASAPQKLHLLGQMATLLKALDEVKNGAFEEALVSGQSLQEKAAYRLIKPFLKAWSHAGLAQWDEAISSLAKVKERNGLDQIALNHMVMVDMMADRNAAALARLREASPDGMTLPIENFRLYARLILEEEGRDTAKELIWRYWQKVPGQPDIGQDFRSLSNGSGLPALWENEGNALSGIFYSLAQSYSNQDPYFSLLMGQMSVMLDPGLDRSRLLIADLLGDHENWDAAVAVYEAIDEGSAYGWEAKLDKADLLAASDRDDEAIALLESLAEDKQNDPDPLMSIALIHSGNEAFEDAIPYFNRAQERMTPPLQVNDWFFFYRRGIALERAQRWDEAESDFRQSLSLRPEQPQVLNYLGYSLLDRGEKLEEAIDMVRRAVDQRKGDGYIVDSYGWGYYLLGDYQAAVEQLERAVSLVPYDPVINDHLGDAYWQTGRQREARFQWQRALSLEPEDKYIPLIEEKLENGL